MKFKAAKPEFAADVVESLAVAFSQFPFRALLQPPDGNDDEAHACIFRQRTYRRMIRGPNPFAALNSLNQFVEINLHAFSPQKRNPLLRHARSASAYAQPIHAGWLDR